MQGKCTAHVKRISFHKMVCHYSLLLHGLCFSVVMIHWTRQITEVLNIQVAVDAGDSSGLLDEITFWMNRRDDLSGISQQLQKPGVCHIQTILQLSMSAYVQPFCTLAKNIQVLNSFVFMYV